MFETRENFRLLRVRDIVKPNGILPICRSSFYNLIRAGVVPPGIRLGRTRLWKQSEIANLIDSLEEKAGRDA